MNRNNSSSNDYVRNSNKAKSTTNGFNKLCSVAINGNKVNTLWYKQVNMASRNGCSLKIRGRAAVSGAILVTAMTVTVGGTLKSSVHYEVIHIDVVKVRSTSMF